MRLLKTQLATPSCSINKLSEELIKYQSFIYRALVKGHVDQARKLSQTIVMSVDDPNPFSIGTLRENLAIMFGDEFDESGQLTSTEVDVERAIHCCGDYNILESIKTKAIDVVHWDAWKYGGAPLMGSPEYLRSFVENNGMFAWGGNTPKPALFARIGK